MKTIYIILALVIFLPGIASAAEILRTQVINDGLYFDTLHQELLHAKKSIYTELFLIKPAADKKDRTWTLLNDLAQAQKRGLKVKVLLEKFSWKDPSQEAYSFLKKMVCQYPPMIQKK